MQLKYIPNPMNAFDRNAFIRNAFKMYLKCIPENAFDGNAF